MLVEVLGWIIKMKKIFLYARLGIISILNGISTKVRIKRSLEHALIYERLGNVFRAGRIFSKIINTNPKDPRKNPSQHLKNTQIALWK